MGIFHGPKYPVITNGLFAYFDANIRKSYSGSGTTWYNLTLNTVGDGTLSVNNIYSANNGGYISTNNYGISISNSPGVTVADNFTVSMWVRPTTTHQIDAETTSATSGITGQAYILFPQIGLSTDAGAGISLGTNGVSVYEHASSYMPPLLVYSGTISSTSFTNITLLYTSRQPSLYINGTLARTGLTSPRTTVNITFNNIGGVGTYGNCNADVASAQAYSRTLTDAEITQNYLMTKTRFGL